MNGREEDIRRAAAEVAAELAAAIDRRQHAVDALIAALRDAAANPEGGTSLVESGQPAGDDPGCQ